MAYSLREDFPAPATSEKHLYQPFSLAEWQQSNFAAQADLNWFRDARYGMFIHFGLSTFVNADLSWGVCRTRKAPDCGEGPVPDIEWQRWPGEFRLEKFDARAWVRIAQEAGFRYIVLITKHHDGFHMWDTAESEFKITNTPFGRDPVKEVTDACHEANMPVGLYYSQRDWYHPDYMPVDPEKVIQNGINWTLKPGFDTPVGKTHAKYLAYQERVVRELCTRYGKIDIFWWDAVWWGNMFTAEMWDAERITRVIRELQPGIIINNRCCIPGDFDTPEGRLGFFQNWRPWESCICLTATWSYSGTEPKSLEHLIRMITNNICGDGNLLLSWGPHWDGEFDPAERKRLIEFGAWLKACERAIFNTRGGPWKPNNWGGSVHRGKSVFLHVIHLPDETLELPALPERTLANAALLDGTPVSFEIHDSFIRLRIPRAAQTPPDTIVELTFDGSVEGLESISTGKMSIFSDANTCGAPMTTDIGYSASSLAGSGKGPRLLPGKGLRRLRTRQEPNPWVVLDLGGTMMVTGMQVEFAAFRPGRDVRVFVSADGNTWDECGSLSQPFGEVPVNGYRVGAWLPGRKVSHVKLQDMQVDHTSLDINNLTVYAKSSQEYSLGQ